MQEAVFTVRAHKMVKKLALFENETQLGGADGLANGDLGGL